MKKLIKRKFFSFLKKFLFEENKYINKQKKKKLNFFLLNFLKKKKFELQMNKFF